MSDSDRFDEVYASYAPAVIRYLRRRVEADAVEDLAAETFIVAWAKLSGVRVGEELPWLYRVAANHVANHRRKKRAIPFSALVASDLPGEEVITQAPTDRHPDAFNGRRADVFGDDVAAAVQDRMLAAAAIDALDDEDREVLFLVAFEGCNAAELARIYDCSEPAARKRLSRARARFADLLN